MKKFVIAIAAIVTLATSSHASQRGYDLRDTEYWETDGIPKSAKPDAAKPAIEKKALAVDDFATGETAFQRMMRISKENENGGH